MINDILGLGGIGDLIVTCTSTHSRNYTLGFKLGQGQTMDEALNEMNMVVEGIYTTNSVYHLAKQQNVDMPITNALYKVLFEDNPVKDSVKDLMGRDKNLNKSVILLIIKIFRRFVHKILIFQCFKCINYCGNINCCVKVIA